jgi:hypothetical protein
VTKNRPITTGGVSGPRKSGAGESVVAHYVALRVGQMRLSASRSSCATGIVCGAASRHWTVVVRIR